MSIEAIQGIIKILGVGEYIVPIIEVVMVTMHKATKDTEDITIMEEVNLGNKFIIEEGVMSFERQNRSRRNGRSGSNSRPRSGSRASTNRDGIRCFECREYDHFA